MRVLGTHLRSLTELSGTSGMAFAIYLKSEPPTGLNRNFRFTGAPIMSTAQAGTNVLTLTEEEKTALLRILEQELVEVHAESRRTEAPAYQQQVHHQETVIRALTEKVRQLQR